MLSKSYELEVNEVKENNPDDNLNDDVKLIGEFQLEMLWTEVYRHPSWIETDN